VTIDTSVSRLKTLELFINYNPVLTRMLRRIVPVAEVDDILQETFIRVHEAEVRKRIKYPKAFFYTTARNLALNFIARKDNRCIEKFEDLQDFDVLDVNTCCADEYESKEKFRTLCAAVKDLPTQCRKAFIMKRVFGYSLREISARLDISQSTAEKHIAKGVLRCADYLKNKGYAVNGRVKHSIKSNLG